ncbi:MULTISPECIES: hypothetical protein [unclassified Acinetobacter]|uniref:hypothetical protein n=1 Tax=unclassified Acinetobacter TaxID=196816 RepID=UPI0015D301C2|nr:MULTISPECIES: hypothetical protein [unclassified Acinetobacter]
MTGLAINSQSNAFSIATLIYARLRRVSGRVIDALYVVENVEYARFVSNLALATADPELSRLVARLYSELNLHEAAVSEAEELTDSSVQPETAEILMSEPTAEDICKAQVAHRYIGALR